jgi:putative membrane protein
MIGSLNKIWPWKETLTTRLNSKGEIIPVIQQNLWPTDYMAKIGEPLVLDALLFFSFGILIIIGVEKIAQVSRQKN